MRLMVAGFALAFGLDQLSKNLVIHWMGLVDRLAIDVLPPILNFRYGENTGINFGLFDGGADMGRWILIGISILISIALSVWTLRQPPHRGLRFAAGLVAGGAIGNVLDRLVYGYVLDFLNMSCCGIHNPFVFNVADVFIFGGAAALILFDSQLKKPT